MLPNAGSIGPHSAFAAGLKRAQTGAKLRFAPFHDRVAVVTRRADGVIAVVNVPPAAVLFGNDCTATYLLRLTLSAVLPLPKTSYANPVLGSRSCHLTPSAAASARFRAGTNSPGP